MAGTASQNLALSNEDLPGKTSVNIPKKLLLLQHGDQYENVLINKKRRILEVSIEELEDLMEHHKNELADQYKDLEQLPEPIMTAAGLDVNKGKSRYKGLYPADDFRVILNRPPGDTQSDFINASHIRGYTRKCKQYIAAQGPMVKTVADFWLMIWQQEPSAIVMLTRIVENGKKKCEEYWTNYVGASMLFGDIDVVTESIDSWNSFTFTRLVARKDGRSKSFLHCHYLVWPDHDAPDETSSFINFYRAVKALTDNLPGPYLVHCSAGVGRTGTFLALDYLMQQAKATKKVNPFQFVKEMREKRPSMIQKEIQYIYLHEVLLECMTTDKFLKQTPEEKLTHHSKSPRGSLIAQEFARLETMSQSASLRYEAANSAENLNKNQTPSILASDNYRVFLRDTPHDYINAIIVPSPRDKDTFIATQLPLSNTVGDFWRMVAGERTTIIIQLEHSNIQFVPQHDGERLDIDDAAVKRISSSTDFDSDLINITVKTKYTTEKTVKLYRISNQHSDLWDEMVSNPTSFTNFLQKFLAMDRNSLSCVIVMCRDGATRCGMFICGYNLLKKFKDTEDSDVYNTVLEAKRRRPQFIPNVHQLVSVYSCLKRYEADETEEIVYENV